MHIPLLVYVVQTPAMQDSAVLSPCQQVDTTSSRGSELHAGSDAMCLCDVLLCRRTKGMP